MRSKHTYATAFLVTATLFTTVAFSKPNQQDMATDIRKVDLIGPVVSLEKTPIRLKFNRDFVLENRIDSLVEGTEIPRRDFQLAFTGEQINCEIKVSGDEVYSWDAVKLNPSSNFTGTGALVRKSNRELLRKYFDISSGSPMSALVKQVSRNIGDVNEPRDVISQTVSVQFDLQNKSGVKLVLACSYMEQFVMNTKIVLEEVWSLHYSMNKGLYQSQCRSIGGNTVELTDVSGNKLKDKVVCNGVLAAIKTPVRLTYKLITEFLKANGFTLDIPESKKIDVRIAEGYQTPAG